jgi:hypothetical protein
MGINVLVYINVLYRKFYTNRPFSHPTSDKIGCLGQVDRAGEKTPRPDRPNVRVRVPAEPYRTVLVCAVIFFDAFGGFAISRLARARSLSTFGAGWLAKIRCVRVLKWSTLIPTTVFGVCWLWERSAHSRPGSHWYFGMLLPWWGARGYVARFTSPFFVDLASIGLIIS